MSQITNYLDMLPDTTNTLDIGSSSLKFKDGWFTGTLGAGAITGTSFIIGANTLDTSEWAFLDGQDQAVNTTSSPYFTALGIGVTPTSPLHLKALATNATLVNIDGSTVDYTGASTNYGLKITRDIAPATSPTSLISYGSSNVLTNLYAESGSITTSSLTNYGNYNSTTVSGVHTFVPVLSCTETNYGSYNLVTRTTGANAITSKKLTIKNYGMYNAVTDSITYNNTDGETLTVSNYGGYFAVTSGGAETAGTLIKNNYGFYATVSSTTVGTSTNIGAYIEVISAADTNWGFYNGSGSTKNAHNFLGNDDIKTYFGAGLDLSIYHDGTNSFIDNATGKLKLAVSTVSQVELIDGIFQPTTDSDVDLGTSILYFKDAYLDRVLSPIIKTDITTPTDLTITTGAAKTLVLSTSVYDDLQFQVSYAKVNPANTAPSWETFTATTSEYAFSIDDEADTAANELPHWWKEGTTGNAHLHITTKGVPAEEQKAQFTVTFAYADTNEVWVEQALTAEKVIPISTTALTNLYLDLGDLTFTNYLVGAQVKCRIKRVAKTAGGTEYAGDIFITQVGIHLSKDTLGSRQETVK